MPDIHQIVTGAGPGDAITSMALHLRELLRARPAGHRSRIYARHLAPELEHEVLPLAELPGGSPHDVLVYHASFGTPDVTRTLLGRPERLVIVYHNITPWQLFLDADPDFAAKLHWGRHELTLLRDRAKLTVAVSDFNRRDLERLGYRDVEVLPVGLDPMRLLACAPEADVARRLLREQPNGYVLSVSQVLPHKRTDLLIQAMHLVQWCHDCHLGLVIAGHQRMAPYAAAVHELARSLHVRGVWFTGPVSDPTLATLYRGAAIFATASAHEGLALPPLEAMSFGVPVVAIGTGALPETIGDAGLVLPADAGPMLLAEAIAEVAHDGARREAMRVAGCARAAAVTASDPSRAFVRLLESTVLR